MQSSSLIFVLVVAIWAVYLLQYWVKRRDHLATVRSVDRFSAAMRVLETHRAPGGAEATPRSYAIAPTRAARPTVSVKRASDSARTVDDVDLESPEPAAHRPGVVSRVVDAPRRVRGLTVLTMLALLPVVLLVAAFGPLPWWTPVVWLVGTVAAFAWLRESVVAARRSAPRRPASHAAPIDEEATRPARSAQARPHSTRTPAARVTTEAVSPTLAELDVDEVVSVTETAGEPVPTAVAEAAPAATLEPGSWSPVPVPRPTYTMKARAHRAEPEMVEEAGRPASDASPQPQSPSLPGTLEELPAVDADLVDPAQTRRVVNG